MNLLKRREELPTQGERILDRLQRAGNKGVTNIELNRVAFRYGARLHELRKDGYRIATKYVKPGVFRFVLVGQEHVL